MPNDIIIRDDFCQSLIEDASNILNRDIKLQFEWSLETSHQAKQKIFEKLEKKFDLIQTETSLIIKRLPILDNIIIPYLSDSSLDNINTNQVTEPRNSNAEIVVTWIVRVYFNNMYIPDDIVHLISTYSGTIKMVSYFPAWGYDKDKYLFKLVMIGDSGVGKSTLLKRFTDDTYDGLCHATIGVDFKIKTVELNMKEIKLQIWDTDGHERAAQTTAAYLRGAHAIMIVFDVHDSDSFTNIGDLWLPLVSKHAPYNACKIIVGTKSDVGEKRTLDYWMVEQYCNDLGIPHLDVSAKNATNVEQAFLMLAAAVRTECESYSRVNVHE
eukprot:477339_1